MKLCLGCVKKKENLVLDGFHERGKEELGRREGVEGILKKEGRNDGEVREERRRVK